MDDIEDLTIDMDEVNECFKRGLKQHGDQYLSLITKKAQADRSLSKVKDLDKAINKLKDIQKSQSKNVVRELERFGFDTETIHRLGGIFVDSIRPKKASRGSSDERDTINEYEEDFEDYDSEEEDMHSKIGVYNTHQSNNTYSKTTTQLAPRYEEREPHIVENRRPHTIASSTVSNTASSSKFKNLSWIKKGRWRLGEKIGSGSFGDVFQGLSDEGKLFAVKRLSMSNTKEVENLTSEIELMQTLSHTNIVRYLGFKVMHSNASQIFRFSNNNLFCICLSL
jgi:hypothetical protein